MIIAPLEQFQILIPNNLKIFYINIVITNFLIINLITILSVFNTMFFSTGRSNKKNIFYVAPYSWQQTTELCWAIAAQLITNTIKNNNQKYLLFILTIFNFVLFSNLLGLIPYSFTTTSHLFVTFNLAFSIFIGLSFVVIKKYKFKTFLLFFPANTSIYLAFLIIPIELISFIAKPISLGIRLFINLMAGHTLLKVIVGFCWNLTILKNFNSIYSIFCLIALIFLFGLELSVALIQTYVFTVLACIYIQDIKKTNAFN